MRFFSVVRLFFIFVLSTLIAPLAYAQSLYETVNLGDVPLCTSVTSRINGFVAAGTPPFSWQTTSTETLNGSSDFSVPPVGQISDDCNGRTVTDTACYFYLVFRPTQLGPQTVIVSENQTVVGLSSGVPVEGYSATYLVQVNAIGDGSGSTSCSAPDLSVSGISITQPPGTPVASDTSGNPILVPGQPAQALVTFGATGIQAGDTRSTDVSLFYGSQSIGSGTVALSSLQSGSFSEAVNFTPSGTGIQPLIATIDSSNTLKETNVANNTLTQNIDLPSPLDLSVGTVILTQTSPANSMSVANGYDANGLAMIAPGYPGQVAVTVNATGIQPGDTRSTSVSVLLGSLQVGSATVQLSSLQNGSQVVNIPFTIPKPANANDRLTLSNAQTLSIQIDPGNALQETTMTNNTAALSIYVIPICDISEHNVAVRSDWTQGGSWGADYYGPNGKTKNEHMSQYGCYLTSVALLMNAYGIKTTPGGSPLTPRTLNADGSNTTYNGVYSMMTANGGVIGNGMADYGRAAYSASCKASNPGASDASCDDAGDSAISYKSNIKNYDPELAANYICNSGDPVILQVLVPGTASKQIHGHFIIATSTTIDSTGLLTYKIVDAGNSRNNGQLLSARYPDSQNPIEGMRVFVNSADPTKMTVVGSETISYILTDPTGHRTGFDPATNQAYSEIPGALYYTDFIANEDPTSTAADLLPNTLLEHSVNVLEGNYTIDVYANQAGPFSVNVFGYDSNGNINQSQPIVGTLKAGQHQVYSFTQTAQAVAQGTLTIKNALLLDPKKSNGDMLLLKGTLVSASTPSASLLPVKSSISVSFGSSRYIIKASDLKSIGKNTLVYDSRQNGGIAFTINSKGEFGVYFRQIDLGQVRSGAIEQVDMQIDSVRGTGTVKFSCFGPICFSH